MEDTLQEYRVYFENILDYFLRKEFQIHRDGFIKSAGIWCSRGASTYKINRKQISADLSGALLLVHSYFSDNFAPANISAKELNKANFSFAKIMHLSRPHELIFEDDVLIKLVPKNLPEFPFEATVAFVSAWDGLGLNSVYARAYPNISKLGQDLSIKYLGKFPTLD